MIFEENCIHTKLANTNPREGRTNPNPQNGQPPPKRGKGQPNRKGHPAIQVPTPNLRREGQPLHRERRVNPQPASDKSELSRIPSLLASDPGAAVTCHVVGHVLFPHKGHAQRESPHLSSPTPQNEVMLHRSRVFQDAANHFQKLSGSFVATTSSATMRGHVTGQVFFLHLSHDRQSLS